MSNSKLTPYLDIIFGFFGELYFLIPNERSFDSLRILQIQSFELNVTFVFNLCKRDCNAGCSLNVTQIWLNRMRCSLYTEITYLKLLIMDFCLYICCSTYFSNIKFIILINIRKQIYSVTCKKINRNRFLEASSDKKVYEKCCGYLNRKHF